MTSPNKCEKRQVVVNGREIINSYGELVDPIAQKASFDEQSKAEEWGDSEATSADLEYVHAMEYGMPVQAWFGMGIDRIIALITQQDNLRDVVMFPLMKPENPGSKLEVTDNSWKDIQKNEINDNQIIINSSIDYPKIQLTQAQELASKYLTDTLRHCQQVAQVMKYFAKKLGHDEDYWYIVWLLHDVDWDHIGKDSGRHIKADFERIVGEIGLPQEAIDDIKSHGRWLTGVEVENRLVRQYLASVDELSGFLYAYSLMRPTDMRVWSEKESIKDSRIKLLHLEWIVNTSKIVSSFWVFLWRSSRWKYWKDWEVNDIFSYFL